MKAILIDPERKAITEVEYDGNHRSINKLIDADLFDVVRISPDGDGIFVDDEGLYRQNHYWKLDGCASPLAGKGLVLGVDAQGESISPQSTTIEKLEQLVHFINYKDAVVIAEAADKAAEYWAGDNPSIIRMSTADILKSRGYTGSPTE